MPRVKRGVSHTKRRRNLLARVKGYKWGRKNLIKAARTAMYKAGVQAYAGRKLKKRDRRASWHIKIGAFVKNYELSYSKFIGALKKKNIEVDRKILADLAVNNKNVLTKLIEEIKK